MTKMDELGNKSYESFIDYYKRLWKLYKRYGDRVIEVEFEEEGQDEVKNIFLESKDERTFNEALNALWEEKYQIIIDSCEDIEKVFPQLKSPEYNKIYIYPVAKEIIHPRFYVSEEFFEELKKHTEYHPVYYVLVNECVYRICYSKDNYEYIKIQDKIPIASMLKDE